MGGRLTLQSHLTARAADDPARAIAAVVLAIATAAKEIARTVSLGVLAGDLSAALPGQNADGDVQKGLDVLANGLFLKAFIRTPVAMVASEEFADPVVLDPQALVSVAIDPLDGSSNIDCNISIGTIFAIRPARPSSGGDLASTFLEPGSTQLAAGFVIYGPQTSLVLTTGDGVQVFTLDGDLGEFVLARDCVSIPRAAQEYAINASNYRHWDAPVRAYIDDCIQGADGPRGKDFNMRWIASLVADAYRILIRGGVFLYPADRRKGYGKGRLRLVYEASPVAMLIEQAGGAATDGVARILDLRASSLHQRTPLVFGSAEKVKRVSRYHTDPNDLAERSPLFGRRGLLRV